MKIKLLCVLSVTLLLSEATTSLASDMASPTSPKSEDQNILMYSNEGNPVIDDFDDWIPLPWIKLITDAGFRRKTPPPPEYLTIDEGVHPMSPPYEFSNHQNQLKRTLESPVVKAKKLNNNSNSNNININSYQSNKNQPLPPPSPPSPSPPSSTSSYSTSSRSRTQQAASLPPASSHRPSKDAGQEQHCTCTPLQKYSSPSYSLPSSFTSSSPNSPSKSSVSQSKFSYRKNTASNLHRSGRNKRPFRKDQNQKQQQQQQKQYSLPRIQQKQLRLSDDEDDALGDDDDDEFTDYTSLILEGITNSELEIKCSQLFESKRRQRAPVTTRLPSPPVIKLPASSASPLKSPVSTSYNKRPVSKSPFKLNPGPRTYRPSYSPPISSNIANFANTAYSPSSSSSSPPHSHPHHSSHRHSPLHVNNRNVIRTSSSPSNRAQARARGMASKSISFTSKPLNKKSSWNPFIQLPSKCR